MTKRSRYGEVNSDFGAENVRCAGTETGLAHCSYKPNSYNCNGGEGAGVVCDTRSLTEIEKCTRPGQVCLMGGGGDHEGNVYIGVGNGLSLPVCHNSWDSRDGLVVCRELGYHGLVKVNKSLYLSLSLIIDIMTGDS